MKSENSSNSGKHETFYDTLGLEEKCSQDDIKKAYRKLSFMHHPDKNGNSTESTEKFQKISEAFSVLGDPDERVKYDMNRNNPFANIGGMGGMGGMGGGIRINPMDIFNMFMGGMGGMGEPQTMNPLSGFMNMGGMGGMGSMGGLGGPGGPRIIIRTFGPGGESLTENIMGGGGINISDPFGMFSELTHGNSIHGSRAPPPHQEMHSEYHTHTHNNHQQQHPYEVPRTPRFQKRVDPKPPLISISTSVTLEHICQGATIPVEMERWNINSEGVHELGNHIEYISVPMGTETGEVILLSNRGNENADGIRGDVKVTFIVEDHPLFKRTGLDILIEKKISLKDALCGFVFDIEHVNGKKFSFNSSSGNIIRDGLIKTIPKLGLHCGNECGNLNVLFRVAYPDKLSEEQIKILANTL
jgi:DnaJ family protein A protein 2